MPMHRIWVALALASPAAAVLADVVVLRDGRKVEGEVVAEDDASVTVKIPKAKVRKVEYSRPKAAGAADADIELRYTCTHTWGNNGVSIDTRAHLLVFDHAKTFAAKDLEGRDTIFFFTHAHADHYDPAVKKLPDAVRKGKVRFVIPECMAGEFRDPKLRARTTVLGHEETKEIEGIKVHSAFTAKGLLGCVYIVEADGLAIAYVNRCFEGGAIPPDEAFARRLGKTIGSRRIDFACLDDAIPFPEANRPRVTVPVHFKETSAEIVERFGKDATTVKLAVGATHVVPRAKLKD